MSKRNAENGAQVELRKTRAASLALCSGQKSEDDHHTRSCSYAIRHETCPFFNKFVNF